MPLSCFRKKMSVPGQPLALAVGLFSVHGQVQQHVAVLREDSAVGIVGL